MKKPNVITKMLNVDRTKSEFVRWDGKELFDFTIKIPTWLAYTYLAHGSHFVLVSFYKNKSMNEKMALETNNDYFKERWSNRMTKMRKLNNGYMKVMTEVSPRCLFDTHQGYLDYHKELKELNKKYMKKVGCEEK